MAEMAQDVSCPEISVQLGGRSVRLVFNHEAMRSAEFYNLDTTGRAMNYLALLRMASAQCYAGLAAIVYGAMDAAKPENMPSVWAFERDIRMQDLLNIYPQVQRAAFDALPPVAGVATKRPN